MKKGVIMDIRGRKAVVLTPEGEFTTINLKRNHTLTIGSEIKLTPKPLNKKIGYFTPSMPTLAGMAAILLLVVIVTGVIPVRQNDAVAAYVSFDINPSIEVGINSDLEVVQYQAWNSDGEGLNLERETMNMPLSEFGGLLVSKLDEKGYLEENRKLLIVASNAENKGISEDLETIIRGFEQNDALVNQAIAITTILDADYSAHEKANELGLSQGKYMTYLAAIDRGASLSIDEVRNLSVSKMDEMQSETMTAVETNQSDKSSESKVKETPSPIEDSVVQLNEKTVDDHKNENGELILESEEADNKLQDKQSDKDVESSTNQEQNNSSTVPKAQKDHEKEEEKQEKAEKKTSTKLAKEQEKEKKQAEKSQEKAEKENKKEQEKVEKKIEKEQEQEEKKNEKELKKNDEYEKEKLEDNKGKSEEKKKDK
ncbi:anti-sigma factor domain-containing protein [Pseudalkalibacillus hwajinpoensis]|uniref:anti-sigma factor domain-containing protein n=1 Tax=Guptibacillus hwajinpoensis TaxID=208199 RepID=UPI001CFD1767|nr:anti-sigma factor domain-containing protein [Pseudalkalibacillus hwajinpoensis]